MSDFPSDCFKWITVQGVKCIVCLFNTNNDELSKTAKRARKKQKDQVGQLNLDIPVLDTMLLGGNRVYCDLIIYTNNLQTWEAAIRRKFISFHQDSKKITGGRQVLLTDENKGAPFVSVNFYPGTHKLMMQPGQRLESNLLEWLRYYPSLRAACGLGTQSSVITDTLDNTITSHHDSIMSPTTFTPLHASSPAPSRGHDDSETIPKVVDTTVLPAALHSLTNANTPDSQRGSKSPASPVYFTPATQPRRSLSDSVQPSTGPSTLSDKRDMHVDELLFYVQNKLDTSCMDAVVQVCLDFYSQSDIGNSKNTLHNLVQPPYRLIKRRGANKARENMMDICTLFLTTAPEKQPIFVAKSLTKLPPVTTHEFGVGRILNELDEIKGSIKNIANICEKTNIKTVHASHTVPRIDLSGILPIFDVSSPLQPPVEVAPTLTTTVPKERDNAASCTDEVVTGCTQMRSKQVVSEYTQTSLQEEVLPQSQNVQFEDEFITVDYVSDSHVLSDTLYSECSFDDFSQFVENLDSDLDMEGPEDGIHHDTYSGTWNQVRRHINRQHNGRTLRDTNNVVHGAGKPTTLKSSGKYTQSTSQKQSQNKQVTGVFVTRLAPTTTTKQLFLHIKGETGTLCYPQKLPTRYGGYSSFYIPADRRTRSKIMDPDVWPPGVLVKLFYS